MSTEQMLHAIKIGIRSRLVVCLLVAITGYCFGLIHEPHLRLAFIIGLFISSELMIALWFPAFAKPLLQALTEKNSVSWQQTPQFAKFKALADSQGVKLNKKRPFGLRKDLDNAYANPFTGQIVLGELLLGRLDDASITAVVGHEITHIKRKHHIKMFLWTMIATTLTTLPLLMIHVPSIIFDLVFYAIFFVVFVFVSWHNEYEADAGAARIAGTPNIISALRKIVPKKQRGRETETHPSIDSRILKLRKHR